MKTRIVTHRGLDPTLPNFFPESSFLAFESHLQRGYGLEFDVQFTSDQKMIAVHDTTLERITKGTDKRAVKDVTSAEILRMRFGGSRLITIPKLLDMIQTESSADSLSALHLKHLWQNDEAHLQILSDALKERIRAEKYILFDAKPAAAKFLKEKVPGIRIAASVAHPYDIERYNSAVGGTLLSMEELIANKDLYTWAWLDEWDLTDKEGGAKTLYNAETFAKLRQNDIKIALVTPELHGTSPGLLGNEAHPDAKPFDKLAARLQQIIELRPDAICTDYPDYCRELVEKIQK